MSKPTLAEILQVIRSRFESGNDVEVERVHIRRHEWEVIEAHMLRAEFSLTEVARTLGLPPSLPRLRNARDVQATRRGTTWCRRCEHFQRDDSGHVGCQCGCHLRAMA